MRAKLHLSLDPFIVALVLTVILASFLPCRGKVAEGFAIVTDLAIALLFFLHGAKLSREAIWAGIGHWRLHLLVFIATFVMFPILGLSLRVMGHGWINPTMLAGVLFLCLLPSTVQSSIAFTSIAGGNVPAAVCSASASNLIGMFITPLLVSLFLGGNGGGMSMRAIEIILVQLLVPFIAGHFSRPLTASFLHKNKRLINLVDRGSILLVVYTAFSAAIVQGLWRMMSAGDLVIVLILDAIVLGAALAITTFAARTLRFSREDEVAIVFCGSKKSLASGVPIAGVLFPAASVGAMIVPLMLFHQMQLMVCALLARRYASAKPREEATQTAASAPVGISPG